MAGGEVEPDAFENPTEDYEVCFVAGTQVLLADGSTKPIEQIRPGDKVLSSHHLTPEETPTSANVVRFFDNGEKEVVRLRFAAQETPIGATSQLAHDAASPQEIVCTPGHRFYVVGKGWVRAQDLQPGDLALSAAGEKIAFVSRENLAEKRRVYNFEVEGKHTYFVSERWVLVHNACGHHFLPFAVLRDIYKAHPNLFSDEAIEVASGFYSGPLEKKHNNKGHGRYNRDVQLLFETFITDFQKKNVGKKISGEDMYNFIFEKVIYGKGVQGDKDFVNFNGEILKNMEKDVKLPDYESARVQGSRLLNRKDRYGIIGMDMKNGRVLARLGVIGALLEVSDAVEAAENSDEILYNVFLEAKRIDQTPNCTEDIKNAIMVTYIHEQVKPYISNSWFDGFMIMKFWHEWGKK